MSHHLTDDFWESLGPFVPFLHELFHNQAQQLVQLQMANSALEDCALEAQSDTTDAAAKATSSVAQAILTNMPSGGHSPRAPALLSQRALTEVETKPSSLSNLSSLQS